jgi:hypothetical protein
MSDVKETAALILFLLGIAAIVAHCVGCAPMGERAQNVAINVWYAGELDRCIEIGKRSRSVEVYEACARTVDIKTCNLYGARCDVVLDGGAK